MLATRVLAAAEGAAGVGAGVGACLGRLGIPNAPWCSVSWGALLLPWTAGCCGTRMLVASPKRAKGDADAAAALDGAGEGCGLGDEGEMKDEMAGRIPLALERTPDGVDEPDELDVEADVEALPKSSGLNMLEDDDEDGDEDEDEGEDEDEDEDEGCCEGCSCAGSRELADAQKDGRRDVYPEPAATGADVRGCECDWDWDCVDWCRCW